MSIDIVGIDGIPLCDSMNNMVKNFINRLVDIGDKQIENLRKKKEALNQYSILRQEDLNLTQEEYENLIKKHFDSIDIKEMLMKRFKEQPSPFANLSYKGSPYVDSMMEYLEEKDG